jgi:hypothetical protein
MSGGPDVKLEFDRPVAMFYLWMAVLGSPVAWLTAFLINFALVPWTCAGHRGTGPLHVVFACALLLALASAWGARQFWRQAGRGWPGEDAGTLARTRFLGALGVLLSLLSALVIAAQWIINFILGPCQPG